MVGLWVVLVPLTLAWPQLIPLPVQFALGNHVGVVSAMGASIAAGSGVAGLHESRKRRRIAEASHRLLDELHAHHLPHLRSDESSPHI